MVPFLFTDVCSASPRMSLASQVSHRISAFSPGYLFEALVVDPLGKIGYRDMLLLSTPKAGFCHHFGTGQRRFIETLGLLCLAHGDLPPTVRVHPGTLLSASPQRHDYNCWGTDQEDVADCVLVRHAAYTMTVPQLHSGPWDWAPPTKYLFLSLKFTSHHKEHTVRGRALLTHLHIQRERERAALISSIR